MSFTSRRVRDNDKPSQWKKYAALAVPAAEALYAFYRQFKEAKHEEEVKKKRERTLKRTVAILVSILVILLLVMGTLKVLVRLKSLALGMATMAGAELPKDENGFTNILLLGEGDNDHEGIDLTDTIMIASIDPENTKSVVLLSIPRDTYILQTEKMGKGRINSLYRDYKGYLMKQGDDEAVASREALSQFATEVGTLIGLPMHGVVKVNFSGFEQTIDAIGGIDVVVPEDLVDTEYPGPNYTYETFQLSAGPQHLDGATALKYARSRHSTSDFSRSARQQQIIAAAGKKVKEEGIIKNVSRITEIMGILSQNIESTFGTRELLGLAAMGKSIDSENIINMNLSDQNGLYGSSIEVGGFLYAPPREQFEGASVLLPVSLPEFPVTWKQIRNFIDVVFRHRAVFIKPLRIAVLNAGAKEGSARRLGGELYRYGFNIVETRNYAPGASNPDFPTSFIAINPVLTAASTPGQTSSVHERAKSSTAFLGSVLKIAEGKTPDSTPFQENGVDIVIVLGEDFQYVPLQDIR
jgi:LCP family protein required for cell wall assembly